MDITPVINSDFLSLKHDLTLSEMIGKLKEANKRSGLVFKNKEYLGVIERKELLKTRIDLVNTKISKFVQKTPLLPEHSDVIEAAYLFYQSDLDTIPVEKDNKIVGVIDALDLAREAVSMPELQSLKVDAIKLIKIPSFDPDEQISSAINFMYKERIDHIPLLERKKISGIISAQDILKRYMQWPMSRDVGTRFKKELGGSKSAEPDMPHLASLPISSFSTNENLLTVTPKDTLAQAVEAMKTKTVFSALVMERNELVGLLTVKNILRRVGSMKFPQNFNVQFIGLNDLNIDSSLKDILQKIVANEGFKLQRQIHNDFFNLIIHFKPYGGGGKQQKYSIHLRVEYPGQLISVGEDDWDLRRAIRKTFNNAKNKVRQKLRTNSQRDKPYE